MSSRAIEKLYIEIGRRIQRARLNANSARISQQQLGEAVGLTRTSITNVEKGRQKLPIHTLLEVAHALQIEVTELLPNYPVLEGDDIMARIPDDIPDDSRRKIAEELTD